MSEFPAFSTALKQRQQTASAEQPEGHLNSCRNRKTSLAWIRWGFLYTTHSRALVCSVHLFNLLKCPALHLPFVQGGLLLSGLLSHYQAHLVEAIRMSITALAMGDSRSGVHGGRWGWGLMGDLRMKGESAECHEK